MNQPWDDFPDTDPEPGNDYIQPADRPAAWAVMAAELDADGCTHTEIATALCVDEPAVTRLLALAETV